MHKILQRIERDQYVAGVGWLSKIISAIASIYIVRVLTGYLTVNEYALFVIFTSFLGWVMLLDYGMGTAFQNLISEMRAKKENYEKYVNNFLILMLVITVVNVFILKVLSFVIVEYILSESFRKYDEIESIVFIVLMVLYLKSSTEFIFKIYFAEHKGYISFLIPAIGGVFSLLLVYLVSVMIESPGVLVSFIVFYIPIVIGSILLIVKRLNWIGWYFNYKLLKKLFINGKKFFLFALMSNFVLSVDYLILANYAGEKEIVEYNLVMKVYAFVLFFYGALLSSLWPVVAELLRKNKAIEVKRRIKNCIIIGLFIVVISTLIVLFLNDEVFGFLSNGKISIEESFIVLVAIYMILRVWTDTFSMLLQSYNHMNAFLIAVLAQSILTITMQIFLVEEYGAYGMVVGLIVGFVLTVSWYLPFEYKMMLKNKVIN